MPSFIPKTSEELHGDFVGALFLMFRGGRVTGKRLSWASLLYLLFAGALLLH